MFSSDTVYCFKVRGKVVVKMYDFDVQWLCTLTLTSVETKNNSNCIQMAREQMLKLKTD